VAEVDFLPLTSGVLVVLGVVGMGELGLEITMPLMQPQTRVLAVAVGQMMQTAQTAAQVL